ncbi:hypothetical protein [Fulvivirga sp.]|uniref:hypothetical protein n=1 Tax=Fulvivirga sp. TaxID=1931237 RepID=UPI0032EC21FB
MQIADLYPTESRLILNPYKLSGRDLIISAISELLFFGLLKLSECEVDGSQYQFIEIGATNRKKQLRNYHELIILATEDHYEYYPKPIDKDSILTPIRLVRDVYGALNFKYFRFKNSYILSTLRKEKACRTTFPFYYLRAILTKEGKELERGLKHLVTELENYYAYYKEHDPQKIKRIIEDLGPNILLAYNIKRISKELKIWKNEGFFDSEFSFFMSPLTTESMGDFELPDLDLPVFEFPTLEPIDMVGDTPFSSD